MAFALPIHKGGEIVADAKRYYWLRLYDDFFGSKRIKKLRKMAGGDTYTIIYLKMQLVAMKTDGVLSWTGLEDSFAEEHRERKCLCTKGERA